MHLRRNIRLHISCYDKLEHDNTPLQNLIDMYIYQHQSLSQYHIYHDHYSSLNTTLQNNQCRQILIYSGNGRHVRTRLFLSNFLGTTLLNNFSHHNQDHIRTCRYCILHVFHNQAERLRANARHAHVDGLRTERRPRVRRQ